MKKYIVTVNLTAEQIGEAIYTDTGEFADVQPYGDDTGTRETFKPDRRQTDRRQNEKRRKG